MNDSCDGAVVDGPGEDRSSPGDGVHLTEVESQGFETSSVVGLHLQADGLVAEPAVERRERWRAPADVMLAPGVDRDFHADPEENRDGEASGRSRGDHQPVGPAHP